MPYLDFESLTGRQDRLQYYEVGVDPLEILFGLPPGFQAMDEG